MSWPRTDISANRYINTYIKGFVDISGGPLYVRNGNVIDIDSVEIASNGSNTINFSNLDVSGIVAGSSNFQVASGGATTIGALLTVNDNITCTGNISASGTVTSSPQEDGAPCPRSSGTRRRTARATRRTRCRSSPRSRRCGPG